MASPKKTASFLHSQMEARALGHYEGACTHSALTLAAQQLAQQGQSLCRAAFGDARGPCGSIHQWILSLIHI